MNFPLLFERSKEGRRGYRFPPLDSGKENDTLLDSRLAGGRDPALPELAETDVVRHYTNLSKRNFGVDLGFYPLGSCTMKYNPKVNEVVASLSGFKDIHPLAPEETVQGMLFLFYDLLVKLSEITGMEWGTLQPFAGAHGEFTGMKLFRAYFDERGEIKRRKIIVPDSAHGTNPASAHISGFEVVELPSDSEGMVDCEMLEEHLNDELAGIMLTNPNTLGIFEKNILRIAKMVHEAGGLLYYDGANLNAVLGKARPGDMGFDVVHLNLHKTFSTPHGGGGPGAGPILVGKRLVSFLPDPDIIDVDGAKRWKEKSPHSIGRVAGFHGNVGVLVRAYAYILSMGADGLKEAAEKAVLNANYCKEKLKKSFDLPFKTICKHEFVLSAKTVKMKYGISALDVAKRLLDFGIHPPTIYFPLIVPEALMVEPTETESIETLDGFVEVMERIASEAQHDPELLKNAPQCTPVKRVDEVRAAKHPVLRYRPHEKSGMDTT